MQTKPYSIIIIRYDGDTRRYVAIAYLNSGETIHAHADTPQQARTHAAQLADAHNALIFDHTQ